MLLQDIDTSLTFVIPVRVDSVERRNNLHTVLRYLAPLGCRIIVIEADKVSNLDASEWPTVAEYVFVHDEKEIFHRTHYINKMLHMADTEMVAVWDTDVLVSYSGIMQAIRSIREDATIAYPYNGQFVMLSEQLSAITRYKIDIEHLANQRLKSFLGRRLCGGAFLVHRQRYLKCGGENERFIGWGPEDQERWHRVKILGHKVTWARNVQLYHLHHPRGKNSEFFSETEGVKLIQELVKICNMSNDELKSYISEW